MTGSRFVFGALLSVGLITTAEANCRQALALGLDVSGSVDAREYRLQLDGLAAAFGSAEVRAALLVLPSRPVEVLIFEWSGPTDQALVLELGVRVPVADLRLGLRQVGPALGEFFDQAPAIHIRLARHDVNVHRLLRDADRRKTGGGTSAHD